MEYHNILFTISDGVGHVSLNQPQTLNALTRALLAEFSSALDACSAPDSGVRCVLLTAEGRGFSSGMNLADPGGSKGSKLDTGGILDDVFTPLLLKWRDMEMPIVVALNGVTAGVTMSMALMGDIIMAARSAYLLQPFNNIGLVPDGGATWLLPRMLGKARAFELSMLAERLPAEKALDWGLITSVHDDTKLREDAIAMARRLAAGPTRAYALTRKAFWEGFDNTFKQQLYLESILQRAAGNTEDAQTARRAFLAKQPPKFSGR